MNAVITFNTNGTGECLYTEMIDLSDIGSLEITRATNIEFNNTKQLWQVKDARKNILYEHLSREACLSWEHDYFNGDSI